MGGSLIGVPVAGDIVINAWDYWHKDDLKRCVGVELEAYARKSSRTPLPKPAQPVLTESCRELPDETRQQIVQYASMVPSAIRRGRLRRPEDHAGITMPPGLTLRKANDLLPFLPAKLPRFKAGDQPLPHTDLEAVLEPGRAGAALARSGRLSTSIAPGALLVALKFCSGSFQCCQVSREWSAVLLDRASPRPARSTASFSFCTPTCAPRPLAWNMSTSKAATRTA